MEQVTQVPAKERHSRGFILGSLSFGHGISHLYDQGFPVIMPTIASSLGLSYFQVAIILAIREWGSGVVSVGGGVLVDMLKRHWGLILTGCMAGFAIANASIGASPNYAVLLLAVIIVSIPGSLWHLPASAALSQRFPDRRGFAIVMHGFGSNIGNALGPVLAGALLTVMLWRHVFFLYAAPTLLLTIFVWWSLKDLGREGEVEERTQLDVQFRLALRLLKNPVVIGLLLTATLRGIALVGLNGWTPFYLEDPEDGLGMGHLRAGFYYALLTGTGIISAPFLGSLSDRFGRKSVLVPGLFMAGFLSMVVVNAGDSALLALVMATLGVSIFAVHQIMQAALLDVVGRGSEATAIGLIFGIPGLIGVASPFLVTLVIDHLGGLGAIFFYAGILTALSGVIVMILPLQPLKMLSAVEV